MRQLNDRRSHYAPLTRSRGRVIVVSTLEEVAVGEFAPIISGLVAGLAIGRCVRKGPGRSVLVVVASVAIGLVACSLSGELSHSWVYLAIDIPEALIPQVLMILALDRLRTPAAGGSPAG